MVRTQRFPSEACNFFLYLYASVSIYLSDLATLKHTTPPQSNLIRNFCSSLTLNETEKVNKSFIFVNLP